MMKFIKGLLAVALIAGCAVLLSGCANAPPLALTAERPIEAITGYATLSDSSNPADMAASVVYTRLAMFRKLAAKKLRQGEITVDDAKICQARADGVRASLDRSLPAGDLAAITALGTMLNVLTNNLEVTHDDR